MKEMNRRRATVALASLATTGLVPQGARAQAYPARAVKIIVPYGTGTVSDGTARLMSERLGELWNVGVTVENMPGAGGVVGTQAIVRAPADGYTLGMLSSNHGMNSALYTKLPYDPVADLSLILHVTYNQFAFCANPALPVQTLNDLIALARSKPNEITYASSGNGGSPHLAMAKLAYMAGIRLLHVPYKSNGAAVTDVLSGQVDLIATSISALAPHVKAGKLRALAVSGDVQSPQLPGVPTASEAGVKGYSMTNWNGFVAPAGLPGAMTAKLQADMLSVLKDKRTTDRLAGLGAEIEVLNSEEFGKKLRAEIISWSQVVKAANVKID